MSLVDGIVSLEPRLNEDYFAIYQASNFRTVD